MASLSVSVIVPVHNRASLVKQTLQALLMQSRPADEIIVVDDGSTDGSVEAVKSFGDAVRIIRTPNGGPARARNCGLAEAKGDFIQFMDSDDLPTPEFIEARIATLQGADLAYGPWTPVWFDGARITGDGFVRQTAPARYPLDAFLRGWVLFIPNAMIRRSLLEDVGGYPEELVTGEDMLLLSRILRRTDRLSHTCKSLLLVRQHPEGQISANRAMGLQRVTDELVLTGKIAADLSNLGNGVFKPSSSAIAAWRRRRSRAFRAAARVGLAAPEAAGSCPAGLANYNAAIAAFIERACARFRYHSTGTRLTFDYHATRINSAHIAEIAALGLEWNSRKAEA